MCMVETSQLFFSRWEVRRGTICDCIARMRETMPSNRVEVIVRAHCSLRGHCLAEPGRTKKFGRHLTWRERDAYRCLGDVTGVLRVYISTVPKNEILFFSSLSNKPVHHTSTNPRHNYWNPIHNVRDLRLLLRLWPLPQLLTPSLATGRSMPDPSDYQDCWE